MTTPAQLQLDQNSAFADTLNALFEDYAKFRRSNGPLRDLSSENRKSIPAGKKYWNDASIDIYRHMWAPFSEFLAIDAVDLQAISLGHIKSYLSARSKRRSMDPGGRYAWRLVWLLDQLTRFDAQRRGIAPNPVAAQLMESDFRTVNSRDEDPIPVWLRKPERDALRTAVTLPLGSRLPTAPQTWTDLRDNAAVAVQAGGGLTPGEVRTLKAEHVEQTHDGHTVLSLRGNGNAARRQTVLDPWAATALHAWLTHRKLSPKTANAPFVFCTEDGRQLHKNSVSEACDAVLKRVGIRVSGGHYRLRHTYAMNLLTERRGSPDYAKIAARLGIRDVERFRMRYERLIDQFDR